jgi:hypothetical protein
MTDDGLLPASQRRVASLEERVRKLEKHEDTRGSVWWKRLLFRIDGWPRAGVIASHPAWRPWRRWFTA